MDPLNYTPLNTEKLTPKHRSFKIPNKVLVVLLLFFTVGVGALGFLLTRERFQTQVPAQVDTSLTGTPIPTPTSEVGLSETPTPTASGEATTTLTPEPTVITLVGLSPTEAAVPTGSPSTTPELTETDVPTPTSEIARGGVSDPTPTEIILAQATGVPTETPSDSSEDTATAQTQVTEIPTAGVATFGKIFAAVSVAIILLGLIL